MAPLRAMGIIRDRMELLDLRDALRRETRDQHLQTEAIALRLLESEADGYAAFLSALHALHLVGVELARRHPPQIPSFPQVSLAPRLALLEQDLHELGGIPAHPQPASLPFSTPAEVLGMLYVIEGSTLGGPTVARRVRALWNVLGRGTPPLRYLSSEGLDVGSRWRAFVRCIGEFSDAHPEAHPRVIAAANQTFAALEAELLRASPAAAAQAR